MDRVIVMNPVPDCPGYLFNPGNLKGIMPETGRTDFRMIKPTAKIDGDTFGIGLSAFFTKQGKKYFSFIDQYIPEENADPITKLMCYEQDGSTVKEISALPGKPVLPLTVSGDMGLFNFEIYQWEGGDYTRLTRKKTAESPAILISSAKGFDTAIVTDNGIIFSQKETLSRQAGLWYFGNIQKGAPARIGDYQPIWK